jgi:hypothetical protein
MKTDIESVIAALMTHLAAAAVVEFTGTTTAQSKTVSDVNSFTGLFEGIAIFGPGIAERTVIDAMDEGAQTITLSKNATAAGTAAALSAGFQTVGRRLKRWDDTPNQPALFIRHTDDDDDWSNAPLSITTVEVEVWIYSRTGADPDGIPDKGLNILVRKIRESLGPDDNFGQFFTIGGRCHWARIEGRSMYDDGTLDKQSKAVLPIKITLP